jgi:DNA repair photolyase
MMRTSRALGRTIAAGATPIVRPGCEASPRLGVKNCERAERRRRRVDAPRGSGPPADGPEHVFRSTVSPAMRPAPVSNPPNPWTSTEIDWVQEPPPMRLVVFEDHTREILAENDSPDVGFRFSVNPYRGCFHGCAYCYARPSHEYLSFGSGTDFERKIVVKPRAAELLREAFERRSWKGEPICFSGNTDCYQPLESSYRLTRACLELSLEYRNPVHVITKSPLVERDIDVLVRLTERARCGVTISVPFWNEAHARAIEPYVATPKRRMHTVRKLRDAGIDVSVNVAPVIPGLNDEDIGAVLEAAAEAGACGAAMIVVRLPGHVKDVFEERLRANLPLRAERVLARTREVRGGKMNDPRFGTRQTGEGEYADAIARLFESTARRLGLRRHEMRADGGETTFRRPTDRGGQMRLFE